jgi:hypothetical protein
MKRPGQPQRRRAIAAAKIATKRAGVRRVNAARKAGNLERAHGDAEFRAWMKRQACVVCGRTPCDAAHLKSGGTGRKADVDQTVPLCSTVPGYSGHHDEYDGRKQAGGKRSFVAKYSHLDLPALAAAIAARWQADRAAHPTLMAF